MRFNVINYLIGEGISNLFKNKKSTISSLMIMCATMLIFGLFFVIGENINAFVKNVADAQEIRVIIADTATEEQIEEIGKQILEIDGVRNAEFISKEKAYEYMKEMLGESGAELLEGREGIFSVSYDVTLTDLELNDEVQESILQLEHIKKIESANKVITQVISLANGVRIVTGGLLILLVIISIAIISNTIKLTVHARRKEISIMKYVGATNSFIRWPFLVEGVIIGVLAGLLSVGIIWGTYTLIANKIAETSFLEIAHWKLLEFKDMFKLILTVYLGLGVGIGVVGSSISMKKYLEV
ncbi:MAG: permease-like cell division protein FtsX [Clostridia bacterium]|nr:permease-like cell division protein FtsX [Clostridia bacterium]